MKKIRSQRNIAMLLTVYILSLFLTACGGGGSNTQIINMANSQNSAFLLTGDNQILRTVDGVNWTVNQTSGLAQTDLDLAVNTTCSFSTCVMVGTDGLLKQSENLKDWTDVQQSASISSTKKSVKSISSGLYDVVLGLDNTAIIVGESGTIITYNTNNKDIPIVTQKIGNNNFYSVSQHLDLSGVTPTVYLAIGANGAMEESSNGVKWQHINSNTNSNLYAVSSLNNTSVVVGSGGTIITSTDGVSWTKRSSGTTNSLLTINYLNGKYVAAGVNGTIVTSTDTVNWTVVPTTGGSVPSNLVNYNIRNVVTTEDSGFLLYGVNIQDPSAPEAMFLSADGVHWSDAGFSENLSGSSSEHKNMRLKSIGGFFKSAGNWFKDNWKPVVAAVATVAVIGAVVAASIVLPGLGGVVVGAAMGAAANLVGATYFGVAVAAGAPLLTAAVVGTVAAGGGVGTAKLAGAF